MKVGVVSFLDRRNLFAVVGASANPDKYGYRVYRDLKEAGFQVYPVNPKLKELFGERCYSSLRELPRKPDVVVTVVPPEVTERVVRECAELGIKKIWMQPGSESKGALAFCLGKGIEVVHGACLMVERRRLGP
ncbi:MAG: CoA-binding protein [Hadesarchaea archaeon]|nr:MAG: CoA-binding protein [Hadesarchaea archaeon]TDA32944.1 MAG: CoA-binding protein [Hadesarchaea archaeon]